MKRVIVRRVVKSKFFHKKFDKILLQILRNRAPHLIETRAAPIAVFGNDLIGSTVYVKGVYEKDHIEDFMSLLSALQLDTSNMTLADIGANIGNHSIQFSKIFQKVLAFEPNPRTYEILDSNTKRLGNVEVFNIGLGREKSSLTLREVWQNIGSSSLVLDVVTDNVFDVSVIAFDDLSASVGNIDVMKIDVEGMELDVLIGAKNIIAKDHPIICLEQHKTEFSDRWNETQALDWLRERGYRLFAGEKTKNSSGLFQRLRQIYLSFRGRKEREIFEYAKLPKAKYPMIYAIHESRLSAWLTSSKL